MKYDNVIRIEDRQISKDAPTYFIADIASNHDGDLERAKELISLAKEAGADAVKFQHFKAAKIVSDYGFKQLGNRVSHQATWEKTVYQVYEQYEYHREWNRELVQGAKKAGIHFMTTPYDWDALDLLDPFVPAFKIGSGDITWIDFIQAVAKKGKPVILATGASTMEDVERAVEAILAYNYQLILLQCNTNYTGNLENFRYLNLRVLQTYSHKYPHLLRGLSDHTPGHAAVLGAITLGARVIEKHFTDDNGRAGPDHAFAMNPQSWREMIQRSRELELALGDGHKIIEKNELETAIVQRRCLRLKQSMGAGEKLERDDLEALRPAPPQALEPFSLPDVVGKILAIPKQAGDALYKTDLEEYRC